MLSVGIGGMPRFLERKPYKKGAAAARCVFHMKGAFKGLGDFFRDAQSQSEVLLRAAGLVGAVETAENFGFFFVGNADAVICYGNGIGILLPPKVRVGFPAFAIGQGKKDAAVFRRIADGIVQEDGNQLLQPLSVAKAGRHGAVRQGNAQGYIFFRRHWLEGFIGIQQNGIRLYRLRVHGKSMGIRLGQEQHIVN